jgi:ABC-type sugar transport system ATPase subunit
VARVELQAVTKEYPGKIPALRGIDLGVDDGSLFVVVGPSGSGKSTLLRLVAGLDDVTSGTILIDGRNVAGVPPHNRDVAMVFQMPALYPHLPVYENLAFGLRKRRLSEKEIGARIDEIAGLLGIGELVLRKPAMLSGGERQRVALGRALVRRPSLVLLDEPLSNLDAPLRAALRTDLARLRSRLGLTMILVTHDQAEALALGSRVAVLAGGQIEQVGPPLEVYDRPATRFVGQFFGAPPMNVLTCEVIFEDHQAILRLPGDDAPRRTFDRHAPFLAPIAARGNALVEMGVRAEHVLAGHALLSAQPETVLRIDGRLEQVESLGHESLATCSVGSERVVRVRLPRANPLRIGDTIALGLELRHALWFDPATGSLLG